MVKLIWKRDFYVVSTATAGADPEWFPKGLKKSIRLWVKRCECLGK